MNKKNLIIFALILIAFTIGAASASQDINNLTVDEGVDETSMDIEEEQLESSVEDETDGLNSLKEENLISSFEDNDKLEGDDFEIHVADIVLCLQTALLSGFHIPFGCQLVVLVNVSA